MDQHIQNALRHLGLTNGEIEVYSCLLRIGLSTTGTICKHAEISNSKVYEVLNKLVHKGLASYVTQNNKRHYAAAPAARLLDYLETKKLEIMQNQDELRKVIPALERMRNETEIPESVIYRGKKGPLIVLHEIIAAGKRGEELLGFGTEDYPTFFPAQTDAYVKIARKHKFRERLIFGEGFRSPNKNAKVRYIAKEFVIPVRTMIYSNKVVLVDFTNPMTTVVIEKQAFADAYRNHFNLLWRVCKK